MSAKHANALKQAQAALRGLTFKDVQITSALEAIKRSLDESESGNEERIVPDWITYDQATDVLTIHGKRYAAGLFGEPGFLAPADTLLRIVDNAGEVITVETIRCTNTPDELLSCIEQWAERLSNCKAATQIPLPAEIHVQGQAHSIELTLREMVATLKVNGRDVPLGEET